MVIDSIRRLTGEFIGDPALIDHDITDVFREQYAIPQDFNNELRNEPDW